MRPAAFVANIFASLKEISEADRTAAAPPVPSKPSETEKLEATILRLKKENDELRAQLAANEKSHAELAKKYNDQQVENEQLKTRLGQLQSAMASDRGAATAALKQQLEASAKVR